MSGSGIIWAICKHALCSRQITMPASHHSVFYRPDALPAAQPTASEHLAIALHGKNSVPICAARVNILQHITLHYISYTSVLVVLKCTSCLCQLNSIHSALRMFSHASSFTKTFCRENILIASSTLFSFCSSSSRFVRILKVSLRTGIDDNSSSNAFRSTNNSITPTSFSD